MTFRVLSPRPPQKPTYPLPPSFAHAQQPYYTTDDIAAAKYAKHSYHLHILRIALSLLALACSIAVIATAAVSLKEYSASHMEPEYMLPLWPLSVDLRPSHAVLGCGIVIAIFSLAYLILALVPLPRKLHALNLASTALNLPSFLTALTTTIFAAAITSHSSTSASISTGTIQSWSCKWRSPSSTTSLVDFHKICENSAAGLDLVILLLVVEAIGLGAVGAGWVIERGLKRCARGGAKGSMELV